MLLVTTPTTAKQAAMHIPPVLNVVGDNTNNGEKESRHAEFISASHMHSMRGNGGQHAFAHPVRS